MKQDLSSPLAVEKATRIRYGVLGFACSLSMITYLDRVCFGTVAPYIQREFDLSDTQKGMLFSAFALAYAMFEVPSGWLGDVFGPRRTLIRIVLWWSLFTALTGLVFPSAAWPWFAFAAMLSVRFLFGMGEAGAYPNIARAFHNWFPFHERGFAQGTVWMAGRFAGGITPLIVLALLIQQPLQPEQVQQRANFAVSVVGNSSAPFAGAQCVTSLLALDPVKETVHWRHGFWVFGSFGVLWCGLFWWWFRDRPEQKLSVNQAELMLIRADAGPPEPALARVPWGRLLGNLNLWTLCLMYFCGSYGWYFNITYLPGYLERHYGVTQGGKWTLEFWRFSFMAGAPLLFGSLACLLGGLLTDFFIRKTGNRKWGRRLFGIVGHGICAVCYFLAMFAQNAWVFVLAIALAAFWNDLTMGSAWASCLDIGRKYSGIVAGCMNTVGNLGGAVAGSTTAWILKASGGDREMGWQINFLTYGGVYVLAALLWLRFDSTKPVIPEPGEPGA